MVVCHCKAINDEFLRSLFAERPFTVSDVTEECGAGGDCGRCLEMIESVLKQSPAQRSTSVAVGLTL